MGAIRQSRSQRIFNEQQDAISKPGPDRVHIYLHKDPQYVVVWIKPSGEPHACNGSTCGCTASQYGMGCRHRKIVRDMGGLEAAKQAAEGEWENEIQGVVRECEPQHLEPEPERLNDTHGGVDGGDGGGGGPRGGGSGSAGVVQAGDTDGVQQEDQQRRGGGEMSQDDYGYGEAPEVGGGNYLRLKKKDQKIRIRLVSKPFKYHDRFEDKAAGTVKERDMWAWIVLHKEVVDGQPVVTAKHYAAGPLVYGRIRDYAMDPDWGNPMNYDLEITRTENDGNYYTVIAKPNGKPITDEQKAMVEEAAFDLEALYTKEAAPNGNHTQRSDDDDPFSED